MSNIYYGIPKIQFENFFIKNCEKFFLDYSMEMLNRLSKRIKFDLKLLSVQFHILKDSEPFAAFGFRKRQKSKLFFVEFYSKDNVDDERIAKKTKKAVMVKNKKVEFIINMVEIMKDTKMDSQIIKWIEEAYRLV